MASGPSSKTDASPRSLDGQIVLEEDECTEALSHVIARDFFPSLVHLDATNNYLYALKSHDPPRKQATVRRLEEISASVTSRRSGDPGPLCVIVRPIDQSRAVQCTRPEW